MSTNHALYSEPKKDITTVHLPRVSFVELVLRRAKFTDFRHKKNHEVDRSSKMVSLKELLMSWVFNTVSHSKRKTSFWVKSIFRQLILQLIQESFRIFQRNIWCPNKKARHGKKESSNPWSSCLRSPDLKVTFFSYMYFTSQTWSLVGCLVAGFGVYPLMEPCITASHLGQFGGVNVVLKREGKLLVNSKEHARQSKGETTIS